MIYFFRLLGKPWSFWQDLVFLALFDKISDYLGFLARSNILPGFLCKILDFVSFFARTDTLQCCLGKILSSSVPWEDQLNCLGFLARSCTFPHFSWQDLRHFDFWEDLRLFGKIINIFDCLP